MAKQHNYHELSFPFTGDTLSLATRIVQKANRDNYILYEHGDELSLGMGVRGRVTVYPDKTVVDWDGEERIISHDAGLSESIQDALDGLPLQGWRAYGTATFELSRLSFRMPVPDDVPLVKLFIPREEVRINRSHVLARALDSTTLTALKDTIEEALHDDQTVEPPAPLDLETEIATHDAEAYKRSVAEAIAEIRSQKYRKVILSRAIPLSQTLDIPASYLAGRQANTPSRSYLLRLDGLEAGGFSPETVIEVTRDREVFTTPLAGTRSTGNNLTEEMRLQEELLSDSKEIAEHAISVYVGFDELTMACDPTSVAVTNFMIVARRGAVQHLASRVKGRLLDNVSPWYAFNALFPAVTASGVPKLKSIDAIGRFEAEPRGLYAGCVMVCDDEGMLDAALVLRSFYQKDGAAWLQAGAGIMNMSTPERELEETREKLSSFARNLVAAT